MSNPVCLVSGSSSGIGATTVEHFARHGYDVVVNYNAGRERGEAVAGRIHAEYGKKRCYWGRIYLSPKPLSSQCTKPTRILVVSMYA